jgi:hypothetical protein
MRFTRLWRSLNERERAIAQLFGALGVAGGWFGARCTERRQNDVYPDRKRF